MPWLRLIRFISADDNLTYFGDAIVPSADFDIGARENANSLSAKVISGNPLSPDCVVTNKEVQVKRLLSPLPGDMIPAIRCTGANYLTHGTLCHTMSIRIH